MLRENSDQPDRSVDDMLPIVYEHLRQLAAFFMQRERQNHTLPPTAIVHEAYMRMASQNANVNSRAQFMAVASEMIRRILVDHARRRLTLKRGSEFVQTYMNVEAIPFECSDEDMVALDEALSHLGRLNDRQARVVELRFFGGLTIEETADLLDVSQRTVSSDWMVAKAWLQERLQR